MCLSKSGFTDLLHSDMSVDDVERFTIFNTGLDSVHVYCSELAMMIVYSVRVFSSINSKASAVGKVIRF